MECFSLEDKLKRYVSKNAKKIDVVKQFEIPSTTLSIILVDREKNS